MSEAAVRTCVKCGGESARVRFHRTRYPMLSGCMSFETSREGEHLHYTCPTCGFDWTGPTADALLPDAALTGGDLREILKRLEVRR